MSNVIKEEYKANTTGSIDNSSVPSIEQQATAFLWVDNAPGPTMKRYSYLFA